jgi:hypothetical protein
MKKELSIIAIILLTISPVFAQFEISWHTIAGGGSGISAGGTFELGGTIGQAGGQTTPPMTGGSFEMSGGFWPVTQVCYCPGDLNGDGQKDGNDIQQFVGCTISGGNCDCADTDLANGVSLADVPVFVTNLLAGPACP